MTSPAFDVTAPRSLDGPLDVAVSVVSHSDSAAVRRCLRSLPAASEGLRWSATVVENLPRPGPPLPAEFPWVRVVANGRPAGFGQNHNAVLGPVVAAGTARYGLVLNDDTELRPGSVARLVADADAHPRLGAAGPAVVYPDGSDQPTLYSFPTVGRLAAAAFWPRAGSCAPVVDGRGWLGGACLLLRTAALADVGLFDTRFYLFYEDTDLALRFLAAGWGVRRFDAAEVVHDNHRTISAPDLRSEMYLQMVRSAYLYVAKHHGGPAAGLLHVATRAGLAIRGLGLVGLGTARGDNRARAQGVHLLRAARYRPSRALPLEAGAPSSDPAGARG